MKEQQSELFAATFIITSMMIACSLKLSVWLRENCRNQIAVHIAFGEWQKHNIPKVQNAAIPVFVHAARMLALDALTGCTRRVMPYSQLTFAGHKRLWSCKPQTKSANPAKIRSQQKTFSEFAKVQLWMGCRPSLAADWSVNRRFADQVCRIPVVNGSQTVVKNHPPIVESCAYLLNLAPKLNEEIWSSSHLQRGLVSPSRTARRIQDRRPHWALWEALRNYSDVRQVLTRVRGSPSTGSEQSAFRRWTSRYNTQKKWHECCTADHVNKSLDQRQHQ